MTRKLVWSAIFAVSMGYFEATIVVYLREIFYPQGFKFPLVFIPEYEWLLLVELGREFFSIIMIVSVAALIEKLFYVKFAFFAFLFGIWDLVYYVVLKLVLDWPSSILEWDILFLIPLPWLGPVLAPCIVSASLILASIHLIRQYDRGITYTFLLKDWLVMTILGLVVIISFLWEYRVAMELKIPTYFPWHIFLVGELGAIIYFIHALRKRKNERKNTGSNR